MQGKYIVLLICYVIYAIIEVAWLFLMKGFYAQQFATFTGSPLKIRSFAAVTLVYPLLIAASTFFVLLPAMESMSYPMALLRGSAFGAVVYGVYNLTNCATLPGYSWEMVVVDTLWGAIAFSILSVTAVAISQRLRVVKRGIENSSG